MALEDILKDIQKQADKEISKIEKETEQEIKKIEKESENSIENARKKYQQKNKDTLANLQSKIEFFLRQDGKKKLLEYKQSVINECFENALKKLSKISEADYINLNARLIKSLPDEELKLCSVKDKSSLLEKALNKSKKKFEIMKSEIDGLGGFIANSDKIEINMTFQSLIDKFRTNSEDKIIKTIFKD